MNESFARLKGLLPGRWTGQGFAKFPTITDTGYSEEWVFRSDPDKDAIQFEQHTWYRNETEKNGKTVFWDTGFILLKEDRILLVSAQSGGRVETYSLESIDRDRYVFNSVEIANDPKTIRSQRILHVSENRLSYELNMNTKEAPEFQNHLTASLQKE